MDLITRFSTYTNCQPALKAENLTISKGGDKAVFEFQKTLFENSFKRVEIAVESGFKYTTDELIQNYTLQNYEFKTDNTSVKVVDKFDNSFVYASYSLGNRKLQGEKVLFVIFNQLQILSCPNATPACLEFCYANKAYGNYKVGIGKQETACRYNRKRNLVFSNLNNFAEITMEVIKQIQAESTKTIVFRWHEAGDIYDRTYFEKIKKVMFNTTCLYMFYTKTKFVLDEINDLNKRKNISIRYSIDETTDEKTLNRVEELGCPLYVPIEKERMVEALKNEEIATDVTCNVSENWEQVLELIEKQKQEYVLIQQDIEKIKGKRDSKKLRIELKEKEKEAKYSLKEAEEMIVKANLKCGKCMKCMNKNKTIFCMKH